MNQSHLEQHASPLRRKIMWTVLGGILLLAYVGSYLLLSRRGFAEAERYGMKGFFYVPYSDTTAWRISNKACIVLFWPLQKIDQSLGTGRPVGAAPLKRLE